jgi:RNA polymerase sigma-70 factor (ECF subfamily)
VLDHERPQLGTVTWDEVWSRTLACAHRYARDPADVEDIAQEAMIRAWRHRDSLRQGERVGGWLATIVRNEAARDASRARPEPAQAWEHRSAEDERMTRVVVRADLEACLRRLPSEEQRLLRLRYEDDLTQAAIARYMNLPEGTVKVRLHRARRKLRRLLSES